jgi:hypothetical protein
MRASKNYFLTTAALSLCLSACAAPDESSTMGDEPAPEVAQPQTEEAAPSTRDTSNAALAAPASTEAARLVAEDSIVADPQARIFGVGTSCSPNPCLNGGTCVDLWLGNRCDCRAGFTGAQCQTATACRSYTQPSASTCGSFYCGLTQAQLAAKLSPFASCNQPAAFTCTGSLLRAADMCGRQVRSQPEHFSETPEQLRPRIGACIKAQPALQGVAVGNSCMNCYTAYQACSINNCLLECLVGDNPDCDTCQSKKGCFAALSSCAGLPNPF